MKKTAISLKDITPRERRNHLEGRAHLPLVSITSHGLNEGMMAKQIENFIGTTQIPLGVAGPLTLKLSAKIQDNYYIPLATTEGALIASINRGCKAITQVGGVTTYLELPGQTRGPILVADSMTEALNVKSWIYQHLVQLMKIGKATSAHIDFINLLDIKVVGRNIFLRVKMHTGNAMGMNMATIATQAIIDEIEKNTSARCVSLAGNYDIDKKPAWLNFIDGRGIQVWAEIVISEKIVKETLKTTPQTIADIVYRKCLLGSAMAGSLGFNAQYANVVAAIFIATGQDPAHVVEGSMGVTTAEVIDGDLQFAIFMPSVLVGTIGGGTSLPTQQEALGLMGLGKGENVLQLAKIIGGAVLAGELSLIASLAEGSLATAHKKLGRKGARR